MHAGTFGALEIQRNETRKAGTSTDALWSFPYHIEEGGQGEM